ncbi:hypothetical protein F5Y18DRAFT_329066 [Xylariaceae sp. FL1019]|nr:hypothetical protein F5Y18DRAFT_329066 [Xylariaceae sp. FL1019]
MVALDLQSGAKNPETRNNCLSSLRLLAEHVCAFPLALVPWPHRRADGRTRRAAGRPHSHLVLTLHSWLWRHCRLMVDWRDCIRLRGSATLRCQLSIISNLLTTNKRPLAHEMLHIKHSQHRPTLRLVDTDSMFNGKVHFAVRWEVGHLVPLGTPGDDDTPTLPGGTAHPALLSLSQPRPYMLASLQRPFTRFYSSRDMSPIHGFMTFLILDSKMNIYIHHRQQLMLKPARANQQQHFQYLLTPLFEV